MKLSYYLTVLLVCTVCIASQSCGGKATSSIKNDPVLTAEKAFLANFNQDVDGIFETTVMNTDDDAKIEQAKEEMKKALSDPALRQATDKVKQEMGNYKSYELKNLKYLKNPNQAKVEMTFIFEQKNITKYFWLVNDTVKNEWKVEKISDFP